MNDIIIVSIPMPHTHINPKFKESIKLEWYTQSEESVPEAVEARAKDMTFLITHYTGTNKASWTVFNQNTSQVNPKLTTIGYIPIIQAPAHEFNTLNTVIQRCKYIANTLGQNFAVITADEALYCKLMELKWHVP